MNVQAMLLLLHISSVIVWLGGMFFAYVCLRPAAAEQLDPPLRLRLWRGVFARFFVCVWWAVSLLAASGLLMFAHFGFGAAPVNWLLMLASGSLMIGIYVYVATGPYPVLARAVEAGDWKAGGAALNRIRQLVGVNLLLGLLTIGIAVLGRSLA